MPPLDPPQQHQVSAVAGWIELGNVAEAEAEFQAIPSELRAHPDVLEVEFALQAHRLDWPAALVAAKRLVEVAPGRASGWLHRSYAARRVPTGGLAAAWEALLPAAEKFPKEPVIAYNLSCYAAQLGRLDDAWHWLKCASAIGGKGAIAGMALADDDLEPLRKRLEEL